MEKTPINIFSTFGSKINEFERIKLETNEKIQITYTSLLTAEEVTLVVALHQVRR